MGHQADAPFLSDCWYLLFLRELAQPLMRFLMWQRLQAQGVNNFDAIIKVFPSAGMLVF
ncbi:MAG: hypothetical protein ABI874_00560 [Chloroflexota bacterium]